MGKDDVPGPVGPLVSPNYVPENITKGDVIASSVVWALTLVWGGICAWQAWDQTKHARRPWSSMFIWMIWLELLVSIGMGAECWFFILKFLHPSFAFYFTILMWWCIQVQFLLQIIINRVAVISLSRERARAIKIATAVVVTLINISVFNIWIPARLQISETYIHINEIWDRIEKVLYLVIDASLNAYFIKSVRVNLVRNGLQKYQNLLKFNIRIVFASLLMDIMIIAAMSIPNSFVYIQFHPLAYLVKLNIEMTMAQLIRKIAVSTAAKRGRPGSKYHEFTNNSSSNRTHTVIELGTGHSRFPFEGNGIRKTQEVVVQSMPNPNLMSKGQCSVETISCSSTKDDQHSSRMGPDDVDDERPIVNDTWNTNAGNYETTITISAEP